jgi:glutaredoxin
MRKKYHRRKKRKKYRKRCTSSVGLRGFPDCPYFQKAKALAKRQKKKGKVKRLRIKEYTSAYFWTHVAKRGETCPIVLMNGKKLKGGYTELKAKL